MPFRSALALSGRIGRRPVWSGRGRQGVGSSAQRAGSGDHGSLDEHRGWPGARCAGWANDVAHVAGDLRHAYLLLGCTLFILLRRIAPDIAFSGLLTFAFIFGFRAVAIHRHLEMPAGLTSRQDSLS